MILVVEGLKPVWSNSDVNVSLIHSWKNHQTVLYNCSWSKTFRIVWHTLTWYGLDTWKKKTEKKGISVNILKNCELKYQKQTFGPFLDIHWKWNPVQSYFL